MPEHHARLPGEAACRHPLAWQIRLRSSYGPTREVASPHHSYNPKVRAGTYLAVAVAAPVAPTVAAAETSISIIDTANAPATVTVKQGDVVTWVNDGTRDHTVTSDAGTTMQSDALGPGDSFATLFKVAGTFHYHSAVAPDSMRGTVIV